MNSNIASPEEIAARAYVTPERWGSTPQQQVGLEEIAARAYAAYVSSHATAHLASVAYLAACADSDRAADFAADAARAARAARAAAR